MILEASSAEPTSSVWKAVFWGFGSFTSAAIMMNMLFFVLWNNTSVRDKTSNHVGVGLLEVTEIISFAVVALTLSEDGTKVRNALVALVTGGVAAAIIAATKLV